MTPFLRNLISIASVGCLCICLPPGLARGQLTTEESRLPERYAQAPIPPPDQLVLVLSVAPDAKGERQEMLVFLGRPKNKGWQAIGANDPDEFREHWQAVAERVLEPYRHMNFPEEDLQKIDLAVDLSIAQFQRTYMQLRADFLSQPDQKSRLAVLSGDTRYARLRTLGREGLFQDDSLVARVINTLLEQRSNSASP